MGIFPSFVSRHSGRDCRNPSHREVKSVRNPIFFRYKQSGTATIAILGFWIPAIPAGMTVFKICVDTHAFSMRGLAP
jgi:hypothetical protein